MATEIIVLFSYLLLVVVGMPGPIILCWFCGAFPQMTSQAPGCVDSVMTWSHSQVLTLSPLGNELLLSMAAVIDICPLLH